MRNIKFETGQYYHIYNRGVDKRRIFDDEGDYGRFLDRMGKFNDVMTKTTKDNLEKGASSAEEKPKSAPGGCRTPGADFGFSSAGGTPLVNILGYCMMPNHFHLLLQQVYDEGISKYLHRLQMGYANYFNLKNNRSGALFQGQFKSRLINSNEYLVGMSAYIHGNPEIHGICKAEEWKYSSYQTYLENKNWGEESCHPILSAFDDADCYRSFVRDSSKRSKAKKLVKHNI